MTYGHNGGPKLTSPRGGWIAVSRDLRDHWLVGFGQPVEPADPSRPRTLSRSEAWIDLLMECRYEAGTVSNGGQKMEIKPGQLVGAVSWLAHRWNWTPKTVRTFLDKLENDGMLERDAPGSDQGQQKGKQAAVLTICNFKDYQVVDEVKGQAKGPAEGKHGASKGQAEGNNNKDNKGTKEQEDLLAASAASADQVEDRKALNRKAAREGFELWQDTAKRCGLPVPRETSFDVYGKKIATRMFEHAEPPKGVEEMLAVWKLVLAAVERSSYLRGMIKPDFRADLKFLCQRESFAKCLDGGFGNGAHAGASPVAGSAQREADRRKLAAIIGDAVNPTPRGDA